MAYESWRMKCEVIDEPQLNLLLRFLRISPVGAESITTTESGGLIGGSLFDSRSAGKLGGGLVVMTANVKTQHQVANPQDFLSPVDIHKES